MLWPISIVFWIPIENCERKNHIMVNGFKNWTMSPLHRRKERKKFVVVVEVEDVVMSSQATWAWIRKILIEMKVNTFYGVAIAAFFITIFFLLCNSTPLSIIFADVQCPNTVPKVWNFIFSCEKWNFLFS